MVVRTMMMIEFEREILVFGYRNCLRLVVGDCREYRGDGHNGDM